MSKHKTSSLRGLRPSSSAQLGLGLLVVAALALLTACGDQIDPKGWATTRIKGEYRFPARDPNTGEVIEEGWPVTQHDLELGRKSYMHYCYACHGVDGDGKGPAAVGLRPPPRDFRKALYKFAAVRSGEMPNDWDLDRIIKHGLHGTPMLEWDIPDDERWRIIQFIKTFPQDWQPPCNMAEQADDAAKQKCQEENDAAFAKEREKFSPEMLELYPPDVVPSKWLEINTRGKKKGMPKETGEPIQVAEDPWVGKTAEAVEKGAELYHLKAQCANCHPAYLTKQEYNAMSLKVDKTPMKSFREGMYGSIVLAAKDNKIGVNIMPPDFTLNPLRSIREDPTNPELERQDLYRLIASGVGGGIMPNWIDGLPPEEIWAITHYVKSLYDLQDLSSAERLRALRNKLANQPPYEPPVEKKAAKKITISIDAEGVVSLDGSALETPEELGPALEKLKAGDALEATVKADKKVKTEDAEAVMALLTKLEIPAEFKTAGGDEDEDDEDDDADDDDADDDDAGDDDGDDDGDGAVPQDGDVKNPPAPGTEAPAPAPKAPKDAPKAPAPKGPTKTPSAPKPPAGKPPAGDDPY